VGWGGMGWEGGWEGRGREGEGEGRGKEGLGTTSFWTLPPPLSTNNFRTSSGVHREAASECLYQHKLRHSQLVVDWPAERLNLHNSSNRLRNRLQVCIHDELLHEGLREGLDELNRLNSYNRLRNRLRNRLHRVYGVLQ
jgi:hypothetical protein